MSSNPTTREHHHDPTRQQPAPPKPSEADSVEKAGTPDAVREAEIARGGDASTAETDSVTRKRARGVEWVRPTDLIARQTGTVAGRGIDFQAELARRVRIPATTTMKHASERARRLPHVSAFGRRGGHQSGPTRSAVGAS